MRRREWAELSRLAWPATLSAALFVVIDLVDAAMLGALGAPDMAGAALGATVVALVTAFPAGLVTGLAPLAAGLHGGARRAGVAALLRLALGCSALAGLAGALAVGAVVQLAPRLGYEPALAHSALTYLGWRAPALAIDVLLVAAWSLLEGLGDTRTPLRAGAVCLLANLVLNALLIPGTAGLPVHGSAGAALSTDLSLGLGTLVLLGRLWRGRGAPSRQALERWPRRRWRALAGRFAGLGWPLGLVAAIDLAGWLVFGAVAADLGAVATAGHAVWSRLIVLASVFAQGGGAALVTLVARATGEGRAASAQRGARWVLRAQTLLGSALGAAVLLGGVRWLAPFTSDPAVLAGGRPLVAVVAAIVCVDGLGIVATRILEGLARTRVLFVATLLLDVGVGLPALIALGALWGLQGCYVAWALRLALKLGLLLILLPRAYWLEAPGHRVRLSTAPGAPAPGRRARAFEAATPLPPAPEAPLALARIARLRAPAVRARDGPPALAARGPPDRARALGPGYGPPVRALSLIVRALLVPLHVAVLWAQRVEFALTRPRYVIAGACHHNGQCCERLLLVEHPFLTWPVLRSLTRFWIQRIYPFVVTDNAIEDPDSGELYRILTCRNLVGGRCAEYALRPRLCREWPLPADGAPPVLFHGCGFSVQDRARGDAADVSRRRGRPAAASRRALLGRWPQRGGRAR